MEHYKELLSRRGIYPTAQRLFVASFVLCRNQHLSADYIFSNIGPMNNGKFLSRATVYNTLNLFTQKGLLQQVDIGDGKSYFDSNTSSHYHFHNITTGEIIDIPTDSAKCALPELPENTSLDSINICVNIRSSKQ